MGIVTYIHFLWEFRVALIAATGIVTILLAISVTVIRVGIEEWEYKRTVKGE